jgi:hypothetical protein
MAHVFEKRISGDMTRSSGMVGTGEVNLKGPAFVKRWIYGKEVDLA